MPYCVTVYDLDQEREVDFFWVETGTEAQAKKLEFQEQYPLSEVSVELNTGPHATIHDACGY
jgi:hypothetical protein